MNTKLNTACRSAPQSRCLCRQPPPPGRGTVRPPVPAWAVRYMSWSVFLFIMTVNSVSSRPKADTLPFCLGKSCRAGVTRNTAYDNFGAIETGQHPPYLTGEIECCRRSPKYGGSAAARQDWPGYSSTVSGFFPFAALYSSRDCSRDCL
jgi:hypothetical protein